MKYIFQQLLSKYNDSNVDETIEIYRKHYGELGLYNSSLFDGIQNLLSSLKAAGYRLCIGTSKRQMFAEKILEVLNLSGIFHQIKGTNPDGSTDDKKLLIRELIVDLELTRQNCVVVGDRQDDIDAAHANGLAAIGILWGYGSEIELVTAQADALCASPQALTKVLANVFDQKPEAS